MSRPKTTIMKTEKELATAERESIKDWATVFRLSAIIAYAENSADEVGKMFGVARETVARWSSLFHRFGVAGIQNKQKGHRPRKLSPKQREILRGWILSGKDAAGKRVHWTLKRLCLAVKEQMDIDIAYGTLSETLSSMRLVIKRPRPMHYHHDPAKADEFKKKPRK